MRFSVATWNINSVRIRLELIHRFLEAESPDVLCLQELKAPNDKFNTSSLESLGYIYHRICGQKSYNGVAIFSRIPLRDAGSYDLICNGDARHVAAVLENGITIDNFYVPAGGYVPDPAANPKFEQKLNYMAAMREWAKIVKPKRRILVGDLNVAPLEDDVWSHKQLLNVVSHTPQEVKLLIAAQKAGEWVDVVRKDIPGGKLYTWWSYRSPNWESADKGRRLDHIWASPDLTCDNHSVRVIKAARGWPRPSDHVPVVAEFDT